MAIRVFALTVLDKKLNAREKTAFALYGCLPLIAIILQNVFKGYAIAYASIIVAIEVLFFFVNSLDPETLDCDAYAYKRNDPDAVRVYRGEYMAQYSWAIFDSDM